MIRREPLTALAALLLLQFVPFARAQTNAASSYPTKPIRFIVPYPPGGTTDIVARGIALKLSERTGQQVVIDNRAGASTILGAEAAAKSAPDGYTLLLATSTTMSINPQVFPKLPYDAVRDFAPISSAVYVPFVIATHPSVPANTITELIALAKANPGTIKYSTPGTASSNHVAGALLETMAGIKLLHVPYKRLCAGGDSRPLGRSTLRHYRCRHIDTALEKRQTQNPRFRQRQAASVVARHPLHR